MPIRLRIQLLEIASGSGQPSLPPGQLTAFDPSETSARDHWDQRAPVHRLPLKSPFNICERWRVSFFRKANRPQQENKIFARLNDGPVGDTHRSEENSW